MRRVIFQASLSAADFFFKILFFKYSFKNSFRVLNGFIQIKTGILFLKLFENYQQIS